MVSLGFGLHLRLKVVVVGRLVGADAIPEGPLGVCVDVHLDDARLDRVPVRQSPVNDILRCTICTQPLLHSAQAAPHVTAGVSGSGVGVTGMGALGQGSLVAGSMPRDRGVRVMCELQTPRRQARRARAPWCVCACACACGTLKNALDVLGRGAGAAVEHKEHGLLVLATCVRTPVLAS